MKLTDSLYIEYRKLLSYWKSLLVLVGCLTILAVLYLGHFQNVFPDELSTMKYIYGITKPENLVIINLTKVLYYLNSLFITGLTIIAINIENYNHWKHFIIHPINLGKAILIKQIYTLFSLIVFDWLIIYPLCELWVNTIHESVPIPDGISKSVRDIILNNEIYSIFFITVLWPIGILFRTKNSLLYLAILVVLLLGLAGIPPAPGYNLITKRDSFEFYPDSCIISIFSGIFLDLYFVSTNYRLVFLKRHTVNFL